MRIIKKLQITTLLILALLLCGCTPASSMITSTYVETLKSWSFQYNKETDDYSLFFGLCNKSGKYISANINADIRIVNDKGEEVYKQTKSVSSNDFGHYTSSVAGEQYLANIRIPSSEILSGKSANGTVYLTIYSPGTISFDEVSCDAFYCLPVKEIQLSAKTLPIELTIKDFLNNVQSRLQIEEVSYVFDNGITPLLKITITGTKVYGKQSSSYDNFSYKLYDSEGYLIDSGNIYLRSLDNGDKFKDDSIVIYNVIPGETYVIDFADIH